MILVILKNYMEVQRNGKHNDLNDEHIQIIKHAYESTVDIPGVVAIVDNSEVLANESKMLISMYVHSFNDCKDSISDCFEEWKESSATLYSTFGNMHTKM